ncbi:MAG: hypothetical protein SV062_08630 [Thermodesulfobacteriota bacterium]|nr:hypothetical protein [Thermodesulfobacteriota bacterium]
MKIDEVDKLFLLTGIAKKTSLKEAFEIVNKEKNSYVLLPELRPYLIGLNYHAPILKETGIPFVYITDNMAGYLFEKRKIKKTIFFYEKRTDKGLLGVTGSLYFCLLSAIHKVPIEPLPGGRVKLDEFLNRNASDIDGTALITNEEPENYIIPPMRELIRWDILWQEK